MAPTSRPLGEASATVLAAVSAGYRHGFDIIDVTGFRSGTVYRALSRLEELGCVSSTWEASAVALEAKRPRRRYYQVTKAGGAALAAVRERWQLLEGLARSGPDLRARRSR